MDSHTIDVIKRVSHALAPRYKFGYYDVEDIEQECFIIALEALPRYKKTLGSLETFLYVHISNRLKNFLRKHYYRKNFLCIYCGGLDPNCDSCEQRRWKFAVKKHLMEPIDIDHINCDNESNAYESVDLHANLELDEIFSIINSNLEVKLRIDYLKMLEGLHIPKVKRDIIEKRILEILEKNGYGE